MQIEYLRLKNFRAFRDVEMRDIPRLAVLVGANGTGKSTLFSVFGFLRDAMQANVTTALHKLGGSRGFQEVRSRDTTGPIEIEIKFRERPDSPLVTYLLSVDESADKQPYVAKEILQYRRGQYGRPWQFLNFSRGEGFAVTNEIDDKVTVAKDLERVEQTLKAKDLLAIKGLAQFERFPAVVALGNLIERWHVSDFHISRARPEQEVGHAEHLSSEGENLSLVVEYFHNHHSEVFNTIMKRLKERVPGISGVESKQTEEGRILLKFSDGAFEDPFLARYVSDGTIKMLAYLLLLYDPDPAIPCCVLKNQKTSLYHSLLEELAEEFPPVRQSRRAGICIHPFAGLSECDEKLEEVFWLCKDKGYTSVVRAQTDEQISAYMKGGDKMGYLWKQGLFSPAPILIHESGVFSGRGVCKGDAQRSATKDIWDQRAQLSLYRI